MNKKTKTTSRRQARRVSLQALYQWHYNPCSADELLREFFDDHPMDRVDTDYFKELVTGALKHMEQLDHTITPYLDRNITRLNPVELAILRLATYEFMYRPDVPYRVVINEALELAREFGATEGHKYINGVLDAMGPQVREVEAKR